MWVAMVASIVGGMVQAKSYKQQASAVEAQGENERRIAEYNAKVAEREGEAEQQAAVAEARKQEKEGDAFKARQRAMYAMSGVDWASGSSLAVLTDTASELEHDRLTILREGYLAKQRGKSRAAALKFEGAAARQRGKAKAKALKKKATGTLITSIGSAVGMGASGAGGGGGGGVPKAGSFKGATGQSMSSFGSSWIGG